jgi:competence protein ComEA
MRKFLKEYFSFSRSELRIIVILSGLIIISFLLRFYIPVPDFQQFTLTEEDNMAIDSFIRSLEKISYEKKHTIPYIAEDEFQPMYRNFDPNTVTRDELEEMRFPEGIGIRMIKYRNAGGRYYEKSDVKKLYGFSDSLYNVWEEYLSIPQTTKTDSTISLKLIMNRAVIDLNSADSISLLEIRGIGPYFAGRIINYRNRLGGFLNISQLMEIKGMDTVRLVEIKNQVKIDSISVVRINLNTASIKDLKRHPYISPRLAESLMKYKQFSGTIKNINEILDNRLIGENEFDKLKPYLKVNE